MGRRERIVVGGDTTPAASAALRWAVAEAARHGQTVLVIHAFDLEGRADLALERDLDRSRRDSRYRTQSWVVEILSDSELQVPVMVQTPDASVEDALVAASVNAAMVVVGAPQSARRQDLAKRLSQRCDCPVVTVDSGLLPAPVG